MVKIVLLASLKRIGILSKSLNFRIFKQNLGFENYLTAVRTDLRISFSKFRCINHKLPIEKGRFIGIARDNRICNLCNSAELGDKQGLPWLRICCSQHFNQMEKVGAK